MRAISDGAIVIGLVCLKTAVAEKARKIHDPSRTASAALGRALTGGLLMGLYRKRKNRIQTLPAVQGKAFS